MGKSKKLLLVYKDMPKVSLDDRVNIVLTPQVYIVKKENLPIKKEYQAKKIVLSVFDDYIKDAKGYSFFVYKDNQDWIFIAYKQDDIINLLKENDIPLSKVENIFFIQQMAPEIKTPIRLTNSNALVVIDGIVTLVPQHILPEDTVYDDILKAVLPKKSVSLSSNLSLLDDKTSIYLSIIFVIFGVLFIVEANRYLSTSKDNQQQIKKVLENYPSLQSSYTRKNILLKLQKIDKEQRLKREFIKKISKLLNKNIKIDKLELNQNNYNVMLDIKDISMLKRVMHKAKALGMSVKKLSNSQLQIKGSL